jgi:uncharacterized membrane protein
MGPHHDNPALADVIERNIETMADVRAAEKAHANLQDRLANGLTRFSGNMWFVYIHMAWFGWWIAQNEGWVGHWVFDPFPFGLLTLIVSLEAIFLSTFVLISQNRAAALADMRADLDLQIDLLAEYEVTQLLGLVRGVAEKIGVEECNRPELVELSRPVALGEIIKELRGRSGGAWRR